MLKEQREHHIFRLFYMILFWIFLRVSLFITALISIIQWVVLWFQEEPIESIHQFAKPLKIFQSQILAYLTFESEEKVYPFTDWPYVESDRKEAKSDEPEAAEPKTQEPEAVEPEVTKPESTKVVDTEAKEDQSSGDKQADEKVKDDQPKGDL